MKKVVLVDGNNLLFRSFYATSYTGTIMRNSKGFPTNALYGFINMLNKIIMEEKPEYIMVALDKGKTFRHEQYEGYKGKRDEMPNELREQFPVAKQVMELMGITYYEIDKYEADDIIGTFARCIDETDDLEGLIVSSDKDLLQLISDKVQVKLLKQTGHIMMDKATFRETYKVDPIRMIDLKALMGDPSDNIPGVRGIGEKTAISLLEKYESVDNLYANIESVTGKAKEKLLNDKENAYMSLELATIYRQVPIDTDLELIRYRGLQTEAYLEILKELEFYSLIKKVDVETSSLKKKTEDIPFQVVSDLSSLSLTHPYAIYVEILGTNYHKDPILGFGLYGMDGSFFIPVDVLEKNPSFFDNDVLKYTYDYKKLLVIFHRLGLSLSSVTYDAMIAGYLLNYNVKDDISYLARLKGYDVDFYENIYGKNTKLKVPEEYRLGLDLVQKAQFIYDTKEQFMKELETEEAMYLFQEIEMPLVSVLADMELTGIQVDSEYLNQFGETLKNEFLLIEQDIYALAGEEFNISSPKQLGTILFEKLQLPYPKKVKESGFSTAKEILDKLEGKYEIVDKVLRYRTLTKIYTTYVVGLLAEVREGRVHTIFNQTLTRTGRLSSVSPNLQNIPIRLEEGRLIRKAFIPDENSYLLSSDYSQVELRIFASLSGAENLIEAFLHDDDIHARTAADIYHVAIGDVTKDMRRTAKAVNFGILYGISSFGLSEDLHIDVVTAKKFMDTYLDTYPGIREFMKQVIADAHKNGYVKTVMGRKRTIEELKNKNYVVRSQGERIALNTPIQGTSADILKKAMIDIYQEFQKRHLKSKMLIQVHDELVFNVLESEMEEVQEIVRDKMENVYPFKVPLKVEIEFGKDWYEAK